MRSSSSLDLSEAGYIVVDEEGRIAVTEAGYIEVRGA